MKKILAVAVALTICSLYGLGCQKKAVDQKAGGPAKMEQKLMPPPPPPPPPTPTPPAGAEQPAAPAAPAAPAPGK
ncbi:MAG: hypothetical protein V2A66_10345 [Pseudomonadota bacterium]